LKGAENTGRMSTIRPLTHADVPAVAGMFQRILRKTRAPATPALGGYLAEIFLDAPDHDPQMPSHVYVREDARVSGFVGVLPLPMSVEGRSVRAAVCGTLMVDGHAQDPFAGARLMRAFLAGPQDISLTETANDVSTDMWRKLRGTILPDHSLEWLRVLRPTAFLAEMAAGASSAARVLSPFTRPFDALARRGKPRWFAMAAPPAGALPSTDADEETTAELFRAFTEDFVVRPRWERETLQRMLSHSRRKALYGGMVRRQVLARSGKPVGLFLYYGDPGRIGRVVQVLAAPGQAGAVIDSMLAHAHERGMAALRGRTMPALLQAMLGRPFLFLHASSSIVYARDAALVEPFLAGRAFFNGFAGESWSRLIGDRFD
jgi:hypothetical protein